MCVEQADTLQEQEDVEEARPESPRALLPQPHKDGPAHVSPDLS